MERVFIDTNAIIELFRNNEGVKEFFRKVEDGQIEGLTNTIVFLETLHVYAILKTDQGPMNLKKRPHILKSHRLLSGSEILHYSEDFTCEQHQHGRCC